MQGARNNKATTRKKPSATGSELQKGEMDSAFLKKLACLTAILSFASYVESFYKALRAKVQETLHGLEVN